MITVSILINGQPIFTRSAVRTYEHKGVGTYLSDDGINLFHRINDGAIPLAIQMLKLIQEQKNDKDV